MFLNFSGLTVAIEITWNYWEDWYLNCKSISKLVIYVKCNVKITIKGHITKVFWRWENEINIYWVSITCQAVCQASSHFFSSFKAAGNSVNSSPHFTIEETKFWRLSVTSVLQLANDGAMPLWLQSSLSWCREDKSCQSTWHLNMWLVCSIITVL